MTVEFKNKELVEEGKLIYLQVTGKLTHEDYDAFIPLVNQKIEKFGKIGMLVELIDFHGWSAQAIWDDAKFALKHYKGIEKLAIVGDKSWEKGMTNFIKVFTAAEVRYFDGNKQDEFEEAKSWIMTDLEKQVA